MLKVATEEEIFEGYRKEIENAELHQISIDMQMEYLLFGNSDSDISDVIKNLDIINDVILSAISKYGEITDIQAEVQSLYSGFRKKFYKNRNLIEFECDRRSIGIRVCHLMLRVKELTQVYQKFIEFTLKDIKKLKEIVTDARISWENVPIERKVELIQKFSNRLMPCTNLILYSDAYQRSALNTLTGMKIILSGLNDVITFEMFINKFKNLLEKHKKEVPWQHFKLKLESLSDKIKNTPETKDSFENYANRWKVREFEDNSFSVISSTFPKEPETKKRKSIDISVSHNSIWKN